MGHIQLIYHKKAASGASRVGNASMKSKPYGPTSLSDLYPTHMSELRKHKTLLDPGILKGKTVLMTGDRGLVGRTLKRDYEFYGATVIGIDNQSNLSESAKRLQKQGVEGIYTGDIADKAAKGHVGEGIVDRACDEHKPHILVHAAALASVKLAQEKPADYKRVDFTGTQIALDAAKRLGIPFIGFDSCAMFGKVDGKYSQDTPFDPKGVYGEVKRDSQVDTMKTAKAHGMTVKTIIPGNIAGADCSVPSALAKSGDLDVLQRYLYERGETPADSDAPRLLVAANNAALGLHPYKTETSKKAAPFVFNAEFLQRDFIHVREVSDILLRMSVQALSQKSPTQESYPAGRGVPVTLGKVIATLKDITGHHFKTEYEGQQNCDANASFADISKTNQDLGFAPDDLDVITIIRSQFLHRVYTATRMDKRPDKTGRLTPLHTLSSRSTSQLKKILTLIAEERDYIAKLYGEERVLNPVFEQFEKDIEQTIKDRECCTIL